MKNVTDYHATLNLSRTCRVHFSATSQEEIESYLNRLSDSNFKPTFHENGNSRQILNSSLNGKEPVGSINPLEVPENLSVRRITDTSLQAAA